MRLFSIILLLFISVTLQAQTVYKTPSGKKYHLANCSMVKNVSEAIDVNTAVELGLGACAICKPATVKPKLSASSNPQGKRKTTSQCLGYTKAGFRCKHMTSIGNGYCYQHQP